ncbi:MAG TPA: mandelate racemase/muconate lactonizing enzyme family protein [Solirubrobacterales bacterium]|nr:mandelate racemase/muconate lactonizing enzyme family protein [Solirubrobacterales bacterium]
MKLAAAEVIPYALPFKEPYVTARGTLTRREMVLLRIRDEDGLEGLGEAVPLSLRGGVTIEQVVRELRRLQVGTEIGGEPEAGLDDEIDAGDEGGSAAPIAPAIGTALSLPARCALSTALIDLGEKRQDPGAWRAPVRCNATLVSGEPAAVAAEAERWAADGFGTFKLKVGAGDDVAQVKAVREAVGPEARIRLDANAAWSLEEASEIIAAVEPLGIELIEQPVETIAEAAELARRTRIWLAGDESIVTLEDAEAAIRADSFSVTGVKLSKVGGFEPGRTIAGRMRTYVASALDGPVGIAISRRLAEWIDSPRFADERLAHGLATQRLFAATIAADECHLDGDLLYEPPGPGLGIVIDEDSLQHHRL